MALLGFEGFDNLSAAPQNDLPYKPYGTGNPTGNLGNGFFWGWFNQFGTLSKVAGLLGGYAIGGGTVATSGGLQLVSNYARIVHGFRFKCPQNPLPISDQLICGFMDGSVYAGGTQQCGLWLRALDARLMFCQANHTVVLGVGTTQLVAGGWYMIEIDVTIDNSVGAFTVHLGGVAEFSGSSLDTQVTANAYLNGMQMTPLDGSTGGCYDDMYTCDTTGPAPYNTFLGNIRVETLFPTSNVSVTWTPLASTNWVEVSEVNMDSDVSYNSQASTGTDTFGHGSLVSTPATIFAINVVSCARKSDVKNLTYRNKLTSGATSVNGVTADLATVYTYSSDMYLVDPHTSLAWDATTVNATVFGYERF